jgi:protein-disulfide isomerase
MKRIFWNRIFWNRIFRAIVLGFCLLAGGAQAAQFGNAQHAIKDDDGDTVANFDLSADLLARLAKLPAQVPVGNPQGDVTLLQFYDLNCPYCRLAAADVDTLLIDDNKLKLVFVPYPVLSVQSVQGALIEMGAAKMLTPEQYLEFHRRIYASRGVIDGPKVLAVAAGMGLDTNKLAGLSNTETMLNLLRANADFGTTANLAATPAYVIGGVVILGHPGLKPLQAVVRSMRSCGKVVC